MRPTGIRQLTIRKEITYELKNGLDNLPLISSKKLDILSISRKINKKPRSINPGDHRLNDEKEKQNLTYAAGVLKVFIAV
jgi:hypothetical protein